MADPKDVHRKVMMILGAFLLAMGLAAAYLAFSTGSLPSLFYGFGSAQPLSPRIERLRPDLVPWNAWTPAAFARAKKSNRLILLDIAARWSHASTQTDQTLWADSGTASFVAKNFVPIRVDADERPDLLRRYPPRAWPALDILLPSGAPLAEGSAMTPALFREWTSEILKAYRKRPEAASRWARQSEKARAAENRKIQDTPTDSQSLRRRIAALWSPASETDASIPLFPFFERISLLEKTTYPWARDMAREGAAAALRLEDPQWGGFYRYARGPGWTHPATGKRLEEQAWAVEALAPVDPQAAERTVAYVDEFLADPRGGYASSQAADLEEPGGVLLKGSYYFSLPDKRRCALGLPRVDRRLFAADNGLMAQAVLDNRAIAGPRAVRQAERTLDRWWREGIKNGCARHELAQPHGLSCDLADETNLGLAFLSEYGASGSPAALARALALAQGMEKNLAVLHGAALRDRPASKGAAKTSLSILDPALNAWAAIFYRRLAAILPAGAAKREFDARAQSLRLWAGRRGEDLDPALDAFLAAEARRGAALR